MEDFIGKYDGNQIESRLDKVKDMVGATASEAGEAGLVPAPAKGNENRFLSGDGTWKDVSYNDLKYVPDPTLIEATDGNYPEDNLQGILLNMIFGGKTSITQNEYDVISSAIPVGKIACKYSYNCGLSLEYGIGEFLLLRGENEGEIYVYAYNIQKQVDISSNIIGHALIKSDLSVVLGMEYTTIQSENTSLTIRSGNEKTEVAISLHTGGDGTKALMDDGTYKSISNEVDITDILIDSENQYKKTITSNDFNNLKQYVLDRKDLYIDVHVVYDELIISSSKVRFISQVISGDYILLTCIAIDSGGSFRPIVDFYKINGSDLTIKISNYNIA